MVNWASGLLGGIQGAASAVVEISDEKRKQLAAQLKQEADWEMRKKGIDYQHDLSAKDIVDQRAYAEEMRKEQRAYTEGREKEARNIGLLAAKAEEERRLQEHGWDVEAKEKEFERKKELEMIKAGAKSSGENTTKMSSSDMTFVNNIFSQLNGGTLEAEEAQQLIDQQGLPISIKEIPGGKDKRWYLPSILEKDIPAAYTPVAKKHEKMSEEDMYMQSLLNRGK